MKSLQFFLILLLFTQISLWAQNTLTEIEYFFDVDPGVGNAQSIDITDVNSLNDTFVIPIDQLTSGIHILHTRTKNDLNQWSFYARQTFFIANFSNALNNTLTEAEYFFDVDPGIGNGQSIALTGGTSLDDSFVIPIDQLPNGIHILHARVKNNLNQWSMYARQTFYIANFSSALNNTITEAEYFFDVDPGAGNGTGLTISENASLDESFLIPLEALSEGVHIFHVRVKNNLDQWSLYARQVFYNSPQILNNDIVAAEFFMDVDPGVGNGTAIAITEGVSIDETLSITIPDDLSEGDHFLHLRVLSSNGKWSLYGRPEFITLSMNESVFDSFKMYPNPVEAILNLSIQNGQIDKVVIIDIYGKVVREQTTQLEQLNLESLASGTYIVQITTSVGSVSKKLIKK